MYAHPDLVEHHSELLAPADDVRLDLRRGPGIRHCAASVVVVR
ncbi:Thiol peroxidase, Bcp-type [Streptomyces sp. HCCB10043]|nr:Thiol peroxidase, Bcp-type [Streptomyces sp. HCCB10043]